jgi:hypothetical protein
MAAPRSASFPWARWTLAEIEARPGPRGQGSGGPVELRESPFPSPKATEDVDRAQTMRGALLVQLRQQARHAAAGEGGRGGAHRRRARRHLAQPDAAVFVTDVDLFAPQTEHVLADASAP